MKLFQNLKKSLWGIFGFCFVISVYFLMLYLLKIDINKPGYYDSYTLQALAWRSGHLDFPQNYNWLEIAIYQGRYYLSFPPVPSLPMLLLSFFFGPNTPATWFMLFCFVGSYILAYKIAKHFQNSDLESAVWAIFLLIGSNYLSISLYGWVWYMAQSMAFLLMLFCAFCFTKQNRTVQGIGLIAFALAIGCRPINAIYLPFLLWLSYRKNKQENLGKTIKHIIPMMIIPACIAIAYGLFNYARFDNPFEFGHNYLPEFQEAKQFGLEYIPVHLKKLFFDMPFIENGHLSFPLFDGFAFYIANPIFILMFIRLFRKPHLELFDVLLLISVVLHFITLCTHKTFGGWQFGTRYLIDLLPTVFLLCIRRKQKLQLYELLIMSAGIGVNFYGSLWFRSSFPNGLIQ